MLEEPPPKGGGRGGEGSPSPRQEREGNAGLHGRAHRSQSAFVDQFADDVIPPERNAGARERGQEHE